jgi:hypothetical protein
MNALMQRSGSATETHAPASFLHPDYIRLFGATRPDQVIQPVDPLCSSRDDGSLGPPHPHSRDPNEGAAGHLSALELSQFLAASDHPSAASLASIADLRLYHLDKGHSPEADAAHGPVFFMAAARAFWQRAQGARTAEARRKAMVAAAAIFVAMIDAHDFTTRQQGATPDEKL